MVGPDRIRQPLEDALVRAGFSVQTILQRMARRTPTDEYDIHQDVVRATMVDTDEILALLGKYFNAEQEQLPERTEIEKWISDSGIYLIRGDTNHILGFVIFDLLPAQLYLRYWFVLPSARGTGVGGKLLRAMFSIGAKTKRQYFWVKTDNTNVIARYRHYGFDFEPMKDSVFAHG